MDKNVTNSIVNFDKAYTYIGENWILQGLAVFLLGAFLTYLWYKIKPYVINKITILQDSYYKINYRIIGFRKHVTAYKNGHGIILQDIELRLYKPEHPFRREINVSEVPEGFKFEKFKDLEKKSIENRFTEQGFWYESNPKGIVEDVRWIKAESTDTKLVFDFIFDQSIASNYINKPIKIMYGYSIPKIYPIENGIYDNSYGAENPFFTGFMVNYKMDYYKGIIGFEKGIKFANKIGIDYYENGRDNGYINKEMKKKDDIFYDKYEVEIKKPKLGSAILIEVTLAEN